VSQAHFESEFSQFSLYFFDPSAQVLVPEPVYLPRGAQASTRLVSGLLLGPESPLSRVERTFIPSETALGDISVPVSRDGVADVALSDDVLDLFFAAGDRADVERGLQRLLEARPATVIFSGRLGPDPARAIAWLAEMTQ
jgi:hypothetical protein